MFAVGCDWDVGVVDVEFGNAAFGSMSALNGVDAFGLLAVGFITESADVIGVFAGIAAVGGGIVDIGAAVVVAAVVVAVVAVDPLDFWSFDANTVDSCSVGFDDAIGTLLLFFTTNFCIFAFFDVFFFKWI